MSSVSQNDFVDNARTWGFEDGTAGIGRRGSEYFLIGGEAYNSYDDGYLDGVAMRQRLQGVVLGEVKRLSGGSEQPKPHRKFQEGRDLDQDLFDLRNGATEPIIRYTDEMMRQIEDERF